MNQNLLKGVFIVLVVVDHNNFARSVFPRFLEGFSFHVLGFMIVPFLRPALPWNRELVRYVFRLYYPFFLITTLLSIVVLLSTSADIPEQAHRWLHAVYSGNANALKDATRMALLWFLPSFVSLIVMRSAIEKVPGNGRVALIALLWILHPFIGTVGKSVQAYTPLGLMPALYVLPLAYLGIWLHRTLFASLGKAPAVVLGIVLYVAIKLAQMHFGLRNEIGFSAVADYRRPLALLINDAEAVSGVLMVFQLSRLSLGSLLESCGKFSLQIYLLHAFVALLVYHLFARMASHFGSLTQFMLSMIVTVLSTLMLARVITHYSSVRRFLFPRTPQEFIGLPSQDTSVSPAPSRNAAGRNQHQ